MGIITHFKELWLGYALIAASSTSPTFIGFIGYQQFYRGPKIIQQEIAENLKLNNTSKIRIGWRR